MCRIHRMNSLRLAIWRFVSDYRGKGFTRRLFIMSGSSWTIRIKAEARRGLQPRRLRFMEVRATGRSPQRHETLRTGLQIPSGCVVKQRIKRCRQPLPYWHLAVVNQPVRLPTS